jgi:hypothetical protein
MRVNLKIAYYFLLIVFLLISLMYGYFVALPLIDYYDENNQYGGIANFHDHFEYEKIIIDGIGNLEINLSSLNVIGFGLLYEFIIYKTSLYLIDASIAINSLALIISGVAHLKICQHSGFRPASFWLFFLNTPIFYYSQLMNKDMITLAILYLMLYAYLKRGFISLMVLGVLGLFVRIQIIIYPVLLIFLLIFSKNIRESYLLFYIVAGLAGAYALNFSGAIGDYNDILGGITGLTYSMNAYFPVGNLLMNPARLIQNIYLFFSAPIRGINNGSFYYISISPMVIYILVNLKHLVKIIKPNDNKYGHFVYVLIMIVLMYPIVNTRYISLIAPFVILFIFSCKQNNKGVLIV